VRIKRNDEWDYADALGHNALVRRIGHRLLSCRPPYVVGIGGSWGAGKTSFLRKLWAYLGGGIEGENGKVRSLDQTARAEWFPEDPKEFSDRTAGREVKLVWFSPWQHQFESTPLVALLHEIRGSLSLSRKALRKMGKAGQIAAFSLFNSLPKLGIEMGAGVKLKAESPLPTAKSISELQQAYDAEHFSAALTSQRFRDYFEAAIEAVVGQDGLLVIFIDDLDRCEGEVAYRLLEALKLYLNAKNCVYVLGIDQQHLEISIARALSGEKETWPHRSLARDYLSKMFQTMFLLPVPRNANPYLDELLDHDDGNFHARLRELFGFKVTDFTNDEWPTLVRTLNRNLPHNPRKLKSFVASWKIYLDMLHAPAGSEDKLNWRLTLILQYLAQFEEPLYRRVEQFPNFYNQHLLPFCQQKVKQPHPLFDRLELPDEEPGMQAGAAASGLEAESGAFQVYAPGERRAAGDDLTKGEDSAKPQPEPRFFWISRLINELATEQKMIKIESKEIRRHLPQALSAD
jgi:KAP family P-loop domain